MIMKTTQNNRRDKPRTTLLKYKHFYDKILAIQIRINIFGHSQFVSVTNTHQKK